MKPFSINVQITKCPKQYEAVRLGMECTLDSGETAEQAIKEATAQLNAIYAEMISPAKPKPAPKPAPQPAQADEEKPKAKPAEPQPVVAEPQTAQETPQAAKETPQAAKETPQAAQPATQPAAPDPQPIQREPLRFGDPRITKAVKRMEKDPAKAAEVYSNMLKYFDPDEQTLNVLKLAAKLI